MVVQGGDSLERVMFAFLFSYRYILQIMVDTKKLVKLKFKGFLCLIKLFNEAVHLIFCGGERFFI